MFYICLKDSHRLSLVFLCAFLHRAAQIVPAQYVADDLADRARVAEESIPVLVKKLEVSL